MSNVQIFQWPGVTEGPLTPSRRKIRSRLLGLFLGFVVSNVNLTYYQTLTSNIDIHSRRAMWVSVLTDRSMPSAHILQGFCKFRF